MIRALVIASVAATAALLVIPAFAQSPQIEPVPLPRGIPLPPQANLPEVAAARMACAADAQRLCPDVAPGGGRIIRCLFAAGDKVSSTCRARMDAARAAAGL